MEQFVKIPNSPEGKVTLAAAGDYPAITDALKNEGIKIISLKNNILPDEVSSHSDMLLCHTGENRIFIDPSQDADIFIREGFFAQKASPLSGKYPFDAGLNLAVSDNYFICNKKSADKYLHEHLSDSKKNVFYVNQGYTKCSVCFVACNAVITEDPSVAQALKETEIDVLLISKGDVYLSDKHYGFFGGSTGKLDKYTLAVTGEMKYHRDAEKIITFCKKHGVRIKELTKGRITDIGGILPLKEER